jgi:hypothetical protein
MVLDPAVAVVAGAWLVPTPASDRAPHRAGEPAAARSI